MGLEAFLELEESEAWAAISSEKATLGGEGKGKGTELASLNGASNGPKAKEPGLTMTNFYAKWDAVLTSGMTITKRG